MATPKILLLARKDIQENLDALRRYLDLVQIEMAIAPCPDDATEALKITHAVGYFHKPTAIVADYPASLVINDDGSIEPLELLPEEVPETPLIQIAE